MPAPIKIHFEIANAQSLNAVFANLEKRINELAAAEKRLATAFNVSEKAAKSAGASTTASAQKTKSEEAQLAANRKKWDAQHKKELLELQKINAGWDGIIKKVDSAESRLAARRTAWANKHKKELLELAKIDAGWDKIATKQGLVVSHSGGYRLGAPHQYRNMMGPAAPKKGFFDIPAWYQKASSGHGQSLWDATVGTTRRVLTGAGVMGGTYAIGRSITDAVQLDHRAALLVNNTRERGGRANFTKEQLLASARSTGVELGIDSGEVMAGMEMVAEKGGGPKGMAQYMKDMPYLMRTAKAFGVKGQHMGSVAATVYNQGIYGDQARFIVDSLARMGIEGDIEIADSAKWLRQMVGPSLNFAQGTDAIRSSMALGQIAARVTGDPGKATAAIVDIAREGGMAPHIKKLQGAGIASSAGDGRQRDPVDLMVDIMDNIYKKKNYFGKGSAEGAWSYMYTGRSQAIANPLRELYFKGGGSAVKEEYNRIKSTVMTDTERNASLSGALNTPMTKIQQAVEKFNSEMAVLVPSIGKLAESAGKMVATGANFAINNPGTTAMAAITGKLAVETMSAALSNAFKDSKSLSNLSAAASISIAATSVYLVGKSIIDQQTDDAEKKGNKYRTDALSLGDVERDLAAGKITPAQAKQAQSEINARLKNNLSPMGEIDDVVATGKGNFFDHMAALFKIPGAMVAEPAYEGAKGGETPKTIAEANAKLDKAISDAAQSITVFSKQLNGVQLNQGMPDNFTAATKLPSPASRTTPASAGPWK